MSMKMTNADTVREHRQMLEAKITEMFQQFHENTGFLIAHMEVSLQKIPQIPNFNNYEFKTAIG